jgi:hypothetical protein
MSNSIQVNDKNLIEKFICDPEFPYLISFPRTGSHWLRMIMELYFEKPSLVRIFYYKDARDFTCYHRHDVDLQIEHENIIYLYRNPVDTIYSQLKYHNENIDDIERIRYWSELYGRHLTKWLIDEKFTKKNTILTYEGMKKNLIEEFSKICNHFNQKIDKEKLGKAAETVSKEEVKKKTTHDQYVINRSTDYEKLRSEFAEEYGRKISESILNIDNRLENHLNFRIY